MGASYTAVEGICGTDLRILRGEKTSGVHPGKVLGHEVAGHVVEAGRGVEGYDPGQPVAITPVIPCGRCWECAHGPRRCVPGSVGARDEVGAEPVVAGVHHPDRAGQRAHRERLREHVLTLIAHAAQ
jgi:threonine dehydrogenase-like Zn-dependent dehydrogenase